MSHGIQEDVQENARAAFRSAFMNLYTQQPLREIKIAQICTRAGCGRSTFYRYYNDVGALLCECEDIALPTDEVSAVLENMEHADPERAGIQISRFFDSNARECKVLCMRSDNNYTGRLYRLFYPMMRGFTQRALGDDSDAIEFTSDFMTKSKVMLVVNWARSPHRMSLEEANLLSVDAIEKRFWYQATG